MNRNHLFDRIFKRLSSNSFFVSVFKVGSGQLIGFVISLLTVPILSRIYDETAYGDFGLVMSTATLIGSFSLVGLSSAIMQPDDDEEAKKVLLTAFLLNLVISTLVSTVCIFLNDVFLLFSVSEDYFVSIILMWLYLIVYNTSQLLSVFANRCQKYNKLFFNPIIGALSNLIIAIPLGLFGFGLFGFMIASIINYTVICAHLIIGDSPFKKNYSFMEFISVFRNYKEYIFFQFPANLAENFAMESPTQFLGRFFSTSVLGPYAMCLKLFNVPIRLVASSVSTVYFRTASEYHRTGMNLGSFTYGFIHKMLVFSILPVVLCDLFAEYIFSFVLGENWALVGEIARIMSAQFALYFCSKCVSFCRVSIGKQRANLLYSVVHVLASVFGVCLGYYIFRNLKGTLFVLSIVRTIIYVFDMSLNFYYLDRKMMTKYIAEATLYVFVIYVIIVAKILC